MTKLDRSKGASPLYYQIATILKAKIEEGEFETGGFFPTEKDIKEEYKVSRITARQAVKELESNGYVESARGIGTKVTYKKINENLKGIVSFTDEMKRNGKKMVTSLCKITKVKAGKDVAKNLQIPESSGCYRLRRVRNTDGLAMVYSDTYLKKLHEYPTDSKYYMDSLYRFLKEEYGTIIMDGDDTLEAVSATPTIARLLGIDKDSPVFKRIRISHDQNGDVVEYSTSYYPGDRYKYSVKL